MQLMYESFKENVEKAKDKAKITEVMTKRIEDRLSCIEVNSTTTITS